MDDAMFHLSLSTVYAAMAFEAWKLRHSRMAACYGAAAFLTLGFALAKRGWLPI
jgi:hypothetical protein